MDIQCLILLRLVGAVSDPCQCTKNKRISLVKSPHLNLIKRWGLNIYYSIRIRPSRRKKSDPDLTSTVKKKKRIRPAKYNLDPDFFKFWPNKIQFLLFSFNLDVLAGSGFDYILKTRSGPTKTSGSYRIRSSGFWTYNQMLYWGGGSHPFNFPFLRPR